uniref:non-specific serine/threonine protein kinase n=1 Tax=Timema bartmani TaxID=61472 RepID=A0A7R9I2M3_9NEOP|nr:unnamed protein product [Timema bartmani]
MSNLHFIPWYKMDHTAVLANTPHTTAITLVEHEDVAFLYLDVEESLLMDGRLPKPLEKVRLESKVKLLLNHTTGEAVAMKIVNLEKHPDARTCIRKEVCIHRMLTDPHIIRYFGQRREGHVEYIFLEYAAGGELFDKIGVAHRDLKPENLLLDEQDNLKISDFGLATIYRIQGKVVYHPGFTAAFILVLSRVACPDYYRYMFQERPLEKKCGTPPYVAPEVLIRRYHAEPADIWSCGIILVAMLAGELPWDQPTPDCEEYMAWKDGKGMNLTPWSKLDTTVLSLIRGILVPLPSGRYDISRILAHRWCQKRLSRMSGIPQR